MGIARFQIAVSLDGYMAGPNQDADHPLGEGGMRLHEWAFATRAWRAQQGLDGGDHNASSEVLAEVQAGVGAVVMGRNMFGGGPGPWGRGSWRGWWGDNPPFHAPVFVVTHHPREPLPMQGGTTFHFVTEGLDAALTLARQAAADRDVLLAGGASLLRQCLAAGAVEQFDLHIVPVLLGAGERPLEGLAQVELEQLRAVDGTGVTHVKYRVIDAAGRP